jgi:hypothetical protein
MAVAHEEIEEGAAYVAGGDHGFLNVPARKGRQAFGSKGSSREVSTGGGGKAGFRRMGEPSAKPIIGAMTETPRLKGYPQITQINADHELSLRGSPPPKAARNGFHLR